MACLSQEDRLSCCAVPASQNFVFGTTLPRGGGRAGPLCPGSSDIDLFSNREGVVDLNPEIPNRALDLRMTEQELDSAQIACPAVN